MNRPDREDAVARALGILPPGDPAANDPRMVRDESLTEEARATREAAADLWLAVSPLRAAPPEVLHSVMDKIGLPAAERPLPKVRRFVPILAASGWAAAVAVAFCLWPRHGEDGLPVASVTPREPSTKASNRGEDASGNLNAEADYWRRQAVGLQKAMEVMRQNELASLPRVLSLNKPGSPRSTPGQSRQQMFQKMYQIVANSFRDQLEVSPNNGGDLVADFVIERGYMQPGMDLANEDTVLRHRSFPEQSWQELGLLRSENGEYFDQARHLLWVPDPATNSFLGRRAEANMDLSGFAKPEQPKQDLVQNEPEGFVLDDPTTKKAEVVIDQVQPPKQGYEHKIVWTDESGATGTIPVVAAALAGAGGANSNGAVFFANGSSRYVLAGGPFMWNPNLDLASFSTTNSLGGSATVMASFATTAPVTSFQLVEVPIQGNPGSQSVIVTGGH